MRALVAAALGHGGRAGLDVAIVFVSDAELARLHGAWLGDPGPTDVLAFDLGPGEGPAGEVYVSAERARASARELDLPPETELALYVVHGCLHLCGYDDHRPRARARMRAAERAVLGRLGHALPRAHERSGGASRAFFPRVAGARRRGSSRARSNAR